ncbi:ATP-binding cassette domain-containing protein [Ruania suaedae]|uniref:sulfate/molybdate ABC transporter ATP-binding protein n=1 Tax=Ruania suaedae TaxID=2897774 RepID=UPI001E5EC06A|nr:ATP-binding cassette domain-containing protein [Ruania suaedae]UFU03568.1 ATP-binding cassette domain-containing protein [Ruania suaedae]
MRPLQARVRLERPGFLLDVELEVPAGQVLAIVGPNAAGKSTLLQVLAGLLRPTAGQVRMGERVLTSDRIHVPPERRGIGLLGQDPLLFDHLSLLENVAFGPRAAGLPRAPARAAAQRWLTRVGLDGLGARRPASLSGGQAQRAGLARALAAEPEVLLLDEPLAALDAEAAPELRQLLAGQLRETGTTAVVVSHDVLDAALLADEILVLREGAVVEHGPVAQVLAAPATAFTAALMGVTLVPGIARGGIVHTAWGPVPAEVPDGVRCSVRVPPAAVVVTGEGDGVPARVRWLEPAAGGIRARLIGAEGAELLADVDLARVAPGLEPGAQVGVRLDPGRVGVGVD